MALLVSDYPRKQYSGAHFEFVESGDQVMARVYTKDGTKEFTGKREAAEQFVRDEMKQQEA